MTHAPQTIPWYALASHPHVRYAVAKNSVGAVMVFFHCAACGDRSQKACTNTARAPYWAAVYARMHPAMPHAS